MSSDVNIQLQQSLTSLNQSEEVFLQCLNFILAYAGRPTAIQPKSMEMALLLDASYSMEGQKFEDAKEAAIEQVLHGLPLNSVLSLIDFSSQARIVIDRQKIGSDSDRKRVVDIIRTQSVEGSTALFEALELAFGTFSKTRMVGEKLIPRTILISDGQPTDVTELDSYANLAKKFHQSVVSIDTIGIGDDHDVQLMSRLAQWTVGKYVYLEAGKTRNLKAAVRELTEMVATQIITHPQLEIDLVNKNSRVESAAQYEPTTNNLVVSGKDEHYAVSLRGVEPAKVHRVAILLRCMNPSYGKPLPAAKIAHLQIKEKNKTLFEQDLTIDIVSGGTQFNSQIAKICQRSQKILHEKEKAITELSGHEAATRIQDLTRRETKVG